LLTITPLQKITVERNYQNVLVELQVGRETNLTDATPSRKLKLHSRINSFGNGKRKMCYATRYVKILLDSL